MLHVNRCEEVRVDDPKVTNLVIDPLTGGVTVLIRVVEAEGVPVFDNDKQLEADVDKLVETVLEINVDKLLEAVRTAKVIVVSSDTIVGSAPGPNHGRRE